MKGKVKDGLFSGNSSLLLHFCEMHMGVSHGVAGVQRRENWELR